MPTSTRKSRLIAGRCGHRPLQQLLLQTKLKK